MTRGNRSEEDGLELDRLNISNHFKRPRFRYQLPGSVDAEGRLLSYSSLPSVDPNEGEDGLARHVSNERFQPRFEGLDFHIDPFGRMRKPFEIPHIEQHIHPRNKKLVELVVQSSTEVYQRPNDSTWLRAPIKNASPYVLRVLAWVFNKDGTIAFKWIFGCVSLLFLMFFPINTGKVLYGGKYLPVHYSFNGYPKSPANRKEDLDSSVPDKPSTTATQGRLSPPNDYNKMAHGPMSRILRPRKLVFVDPPGPPENAYSTVMSPDEWLEQDSTRNLKYLFVAWIGDHFDQKNEDDYWALRELAAYAAQKEGLPAYYLSAACFGNANESRFSKPTSEDVWQLNDVVRGAAKVAIIVGSPSGKPRDTQEKLLSQFASRVWTLPEILLAPAKRDILIYNRDEMDQDEEKELMPHPIARNQVAAQVWKGEDANRVRQLLDHFEGNLHLTRLQLPTLTLECLYNGNSELARHFEGDQAYALGGLLSIRPDVDESDSAFQAFARLSLANDSDHLLERLACMLPKSPDQPWHEMKDAWNVNLWDIEPRCQISGIGHNDTVIVDNAYGAAIQWKRFEPVAEVTNATLLRLVSMLLVHFIPVLFIMAVSLTIASSSYATFNGVAYTILGVAILCFLSLPLFVRKIYGGKVYHSQAWLFGFEGHMPIERIEKSIWGDYHERLSWACFSSLLSQHRMDKHYSCNGVDPTEIRSLEQLEKEAAERKEKIFTLVDTISMTVILFTAARPPIALMVCGSEGGMQRAVAVSYDWSSKTLYKETVLRVPTPIVARMHPVPRFRFGFRRHASVRET